MSDAGVGGGPNQGTAAAPNQAAAATKIQIEKYISLTVPNPTPFTDPEFDHVCKTPVDPNALHDYGVKLMENAARNTGHRVRAALCFAVAAILGEPRAVSILKTIGVKMPSPNVPTMQWLTTPNSDIREVPPGLLSTLTVIHTCRYFGYPTAAIPPPSQNQHSQNGSSLTAGNTSVGQGQRKSPPQERWAQHQRMLAERAAAQHPKAHVASTRPAGAAAFPHPGGSHAPLRQPAGGPLIPPPLPLPVRQVSVQAPLLPPPPSSPGETRRLILARQNAIAESLAVQQRQIERQQAQKKAGRKSHNHSPKMQQDEIETLQIMLRSVQLNIQQVRQQHASDLQASKASMAHRDAKDRAEALASIRMVHQGELVILLTHEADLKAKLQSLMTAARPRAAAAAAAAVVSPPQQTAPKRPFDSLPPTTAGADSAQQGIDETARLLDEHTERQLMLQNHRRQTQHALHVRRSEKIDQLIAQSERERERESKDVAALSRDLSRLDLTKSVTGQTAAAAAKPTLAKTAVVAQPRRPHTAASASRPPPEPEPPVFNSGFKITHSERPLSFLNSQGQLSAEFVRRPSTAATAVALTNNPGGGRCDSHAGCMICEPCATTAANGSQVGSECTLCRIKDSFREQLWSLCTKFLITASEFSSRILALMSVLKSESGKKGVVYSQWTSFLDLLELALTEAGISFCRLDGTMSSNARSEVLTRFKRGGHEVPADGSGAQIILMSLKSGNVGLNLVCAEFVVFSDIWYNPFAMSQGRDRVHRIGQDRPVTVYHLRAECVLFPNGNSDDVTRRKTIDGLINMIHSQKEKKADSTLGGIGRIHRGGMAGMLNAEEIKRMMDELMDLTRAETERREREYGIKFQTYI